MADPATRAQLEIFLLECDEELSDTPGKHERLIGEAFQVLLQSSIPPVLRTGAEGNVVLRMERDFEGLVTEMQTHCGVRDAASISYYQFLFRVQYFENMHKKKS